MATPHMQVGHIKRDLYIAFLQAGGGFGSPDILPSFPDDYQLVAIVAGEDVETAFRLTNHMDEAWWGNSGVTLIGKPEHRSTSVGDVVCMSDGRVLRCENAGWAEIGCTETLKT